MAAPTYVGVLGKGGGGDAQAPPLANSAPPANNRNAICEYCGKMGHTDAFCFVNPNCANYRPRTGFSNQGKGMGGRGKGGWQGNQRSQSSNQQQRPQGGGEVHRPLEFRKAGVVEGIGEPALAMHPPG